MIIMVMMMKLMLLTLMSILTVVMMIVMMTTVTTNSELHTLRALPAGVAPAANESAALPGNATASLLAVQPTAGLRVYGLGPTRGLPGESKEPNQPNQEGSCTVRQSRPVCFSFLLLWLILQIGFVFAYVA